MLLAVK